IEEVLRTHPQIRDCAVVGIPDDEWGELVVAALVPAGPEAFDTGNLDPWIRERLPAYRIPRRYLVMEDLPRNAMGKVTKKEVRKLF
ncbi:MAG TPA: long-chain fatty acid--CoA ligase, partial [Saprospiraceae bacterium]|nr:long-chain fatty acid--CoA ligase [Saprospiraceae bacterium]